jgi:UDP-glucuronate 4-epimerase
MTSLVTGASGFVGLNVVEHLLGLGEKVVAFADRPPPEPAVQDFAWFGDAYRPVVGDIRDEAALHAAMIKNGVDRVLHAAAITSSAAREKSQGPLVLDVNLVGLATVASVAATQGVGRFVFVGSNAIFGGDTADGAMLDEDTPCDPGNLYALSKWTGERILDQYGRHRGLDWVVGRLGGVFGPWEYRTGIRDTMNPVFQTTVSALAGGHAVLPRAGTGNWHFSRDAAMALSTLLLAPDHRFRTYNLGTPFVWSIEDWCRRLMARFPDFGYRIETGEGSAIDLYASHDGGLLSWARFADEFGPTGTHDLDAAFDHYMAWLDRHAGFGLR